MKMSLVGTAAREHMSVQQLCVTGPTPHWLQHSGDLSPVAVLWRADPAPHPGSTVKMFLEAGGVGELVPEVVSAGNLTLALICHEVALAVPTPHRLQYLGEWALTLTG